MNNRHAQRQKNMPGWEQAIKLQVGDKATTDYECGYGRKDPLKIVTIIGRKRAQSLSGVVFQVSPPLGNNAELDWLDSAWFAPLVPTKENPASTLKTGGVKTGLSPARRRQPTRH